MPLLVYPIDDAVEDGGVDWRWRPVGVQQVTGAWLLTVRGVRAAVVASSDGSLMLVDAGAERVVCRIHLGSAVQQVVDLGDGRPAVCTSEGVVCLRPPDITPDATADMRG